MDDGGRSGYHKSGKLFWIAKHMAGSAIGELATDRGVAVHAVIAGFHPRKRKVWRRWPIYLVLLVLGARSEIPDTPEPPILRSFGILDHESNKNVFDDGGNGDLWQVAHIRKI